MAHIKRTAFFACVILTATLLSACGAADTEEQVTQPQTATVQTTEENSERRAADANEAVTAPFHETDTEDTDMNTIRITADGKTFSAELYDNRAAREFAEMLPLSVDMNELNGNEKYYYMPNALPAEASRPNTIHAGDLMLYGTDCLVLFYKDFSTSYSYTPLGRIEDPEGLAQTLGSGNVRVTFELA